MAFGDPYCTVEELKAHTKDTADADDLYYDRVTRAVSRALERHCRRQFNDAGSVSARTYWPATYWRVKVDDFSTITGLVVKTDTAADGTYATTIAATKYQLSPPDGVKDGVAGWPFETIEAVGFQFPAAQRPYVQVTARWGWTAVPDDVRHACLLWCARVFKRRDSPEGVAGFSTYGEIRVPPADPDVEKMLAPFRKPQFGFA
jgi:hypothetical protein